VWPVEALKHAERASDLHFLDKKGPLRGRRPVRREALGKIFREPFEGQLQALDRALLHVEDVVDGEPIDPRF
jgi:hypothetical protein